MSESKQENIFKQSIIEDFNFKTQNKIINTCEIEDAQIDDYNYLEENNDELIFSSNEQNQFDQDYKSIIETKNQLVQEKKQELENIQQQIEEQKKLSKLPQNEPQNTYNQNEVKKLEEEYNSKLKEFEQINAKIFEKEITKQIENFHNQSQISRQTNNTKEYNDKFEQELIKSIEEMDKEYIEVITLTNNGFNQDSLNNLSQYINHYECSIKQLQQQLNEKQDQLKLLESQNQNLKEKYMKSNLRFNNIFTIYNAQQKTIKQLNQKKYIKEQQESNIFKNNDLNVISLKKILPLFENTFSLFINLFGLIMIMIIGQDVFNITLV